MDSTTLFLFTFLMVSAVIIVLALIINPRLRASIKIGPAEVTVDTSRPGWRREQSPKQLVSGSGNAGARNSHSCQVWLAAKVPGGADWRFCLDGRPQINIGRDPANEIVLTDQAADARHAVIYWQEGRYRINNLSQQRGTWVNNKPISSQNLGNGNKIRMGRTELIFRQSGSHPDPIAGQHRRS